MQANTYDYLFTGYTQIGHSLVNSVDLPISEDQQNILTALIDKYVDTTQCSYNMDDQILDCPMEVAEEEGNSPGPPIGLEASGLLSRLPWLSKWTDLFKPLEPVKVF
jgi:hypothetical protein